MPASMLLDLPNVQGVAAGNQTTISCPVGKFQYEKINIQRGGTTFTKDQMKNIRLEIGGKPIQEYKNATQLDLLNAYYGRDVQTDSSTINFFKPEFLEPLQAQLFNLGMADVPVFQTRFDIDAAASAPTVAANHVRWQAPADQGDTTGQSLYTNNQLGSFTKIRRFSFSPNSTGGFEIDNLPREAYIQAIHLICGGGDNINSVEMKADGVTVHKSTKQTMTEFVDGYGRVRQTNTYHIDFMLKNMIGDQLPVAQLSDMRLLLDMAAADTIDCYVEYLSGYAGI